MRRKDKEIKDKQIIEEILKSGIICRLGMSLDNIPYIVPMNYGYSNNTLYFHSAKEGKKIDIVKKNNNVCFEIENNVEIKTATKACLWSMKFKSVIGYGKIQIIKMNEEKKRALSIIMNHYSEKKNWEFPEEILTQIVILKLEINEITGKNSI